MKRFLVLAIFGFGFSLSASASTSFSDAAKTVIEFRAEAFVADEVVTEVVETVKTESSTKAANSYLATFEEAKESILKETGVLMHSPRGDTVSVTSTYVPGLYKPPTKCYTGHFRTARDGFNWCRHIS